MEKQILIVLLIFANYTLIAQSEVFDQTFGTGGMTSIDIDVRKDFSNCGCIQSDDKIIGAGRSIGPNGHDNISAFRLNDDGTLDNSFDNDGKFIYTSLSAHGSINACTVQSDGKIILVGDESEDFYVIRLNADGSYDNSFGTGGVYSSPIQYAASASGVVVQADGKVVIVGYSVTGGSVSQPTIVRLNWDGTPDNNFDSDGILILTSYASTEFNEVKLLSNGNIIAGGEYDTGDGDRGIMISVLNSLDGSFDNTYDGDGTALIQPSGEDDYLNAMDIQLDDKILFGGYSWNPVSINFMLLGRLNTDGSLDNTFNSTGLIIQHTYSNGSIIYDLKVLSSGRIYAVGAFLDYLTLFGNPGAYYSGVLAISSSGVIDETFGYEGTIPVLVNPAPSDYVSVLSKSTGRITMVGWGVNGTDNFPIVIQLDETFTLSSNPSTPTAVQTQKNDPREVVIFPNPSLNSELLTVKNTEFSTVSIKSVLGETMYEQFFTEDSSTISLKGLVSGTYILEIKREDDVQIKKIVIH